MAASRMKINFKAIDSALSPACHKKVLLVKLVEIETERGSLELNLTYQQLISKDLDLVGPTQGHSSQFAIGLVVVDCSQTV